VILSLLPVLSSISPASFFAAVLSLVISLTVNFRHVIDNCLVTVVAVDITLCLVVAFHLSIAYAYRR
jgi:hypothetical protein